MDTFLNRKGMGLTFERGPVSLAASALWGDESRPEILKEAARYLPAYDPTDADMEAK